MTTTVPVDSEGSDMARNETETSGETFYPGPSQIHLGATRYSTGAVATAFRLKLSSSLNQKITQSGDPVLRGCLSINRSLPLPFSTEWQRLRYRTVPNYHHLNLLRNLLLAAIVLSANVDALATKRPHAIKEVKRSYKGLSFEYNTALAREIRAKVVAENLDGKPGDVVPRHVALDLIGYPMPHPKPFMGAPTVKVFPIDSYRSLIIAYSQEMAKSTIPPANYVPDFDDQINSLKTLLAKRPSSETLDIILTQGRSDYHRGRLPLLPMYDVCEPFRSHFKYLNFKNGSGVGFITQYTMESTLIVNQALSFNVQGMTADGKYYVAAQFPIAAAFLPHDFSEELAAKEGLNYENGMFNDSFRKSYKSYIDKTAARIEALSGDEFRPALPMMVHLLESLQIEADLFKSK